MAAIKHPILASDGWPFMLSGLAVLVLSLKLHWWWLSVLCLVYLALAFILFRDPHREIPSRPLAVVSPVDGMVTDIRVVEKGLLNRTSKVVSIKIYKSGAYTTRSPTEGKILSLTDDEAGSRLVETAGLWVRSDENDDIVILLKYSGLSSLYPPVAHVSYGERIGQGQRTGMNRLAQVAELYLPADIVMQVGVGDKVLAGSSVLAEFYRVSEEE